MIPRSRRRHRLFGLLRRLTLAARRSAERVGLLSTWTRLYEPLRRPVYRWLRPTGEVVVHAQGLIWQLDADDEVVARNLVTYGEWEREESDLILSFLRPGTVFVDVGANFGYHALRASTRVGDTGRVIAFEPAPRNFALLQRHVAINHLSNVTTEQMAVGRAPGTITLFLSAANFGAHSIGATNVTEGTAGSVDVPVISLDDYFDRRGLDRLDVMKVDAQGAEAAIISGGRRVLGGTTPLVIILEFWPLGLRALDADPFALLANLRALSLTLQYLDGDELRTLPDDAAVVTLAEQRSYLTLVGRR